MKKLLGLLGAASLVVSTSAVAVACNKDRPTSAKLNRDLARQLIASIAGGDPSLAYKDFGDLFSDADITATVVKIINDLLGKKYGYESTNANLDKLGLQKYEDLGENGKLPDSFLNNYNLQAGTVAEDLLFTEYSTSISSNRLDLTQIDSKLYSLNPTEDVVVKDVKNNTFTVKAKSKISILKDGGKKVWSIRAEDKSTPSNTPELADLTSSTNPFYVNDDKGAEHQITAKTALRLRFQDYFDNKLVKDIIDNILTMSYIDSNAFSILPTSNESTDYGAYINTSSPLFAKTQSWFTTNTTGTGRNWTTNVRMVWSYKFERKNETKVTTALNDIYSKAVDPTNGEILKDKSLIKDVMGELATALQKDNLIYNGDNSNAYDSFFGNQGYKGFTVYDNGSSLGTSPIASKSYESAVKAATKAGILMKSGNPYYEDSSDKNIEEIVFVLPIYMIELLGASVESSGQSTYEVQGATDDSKKAIQFGWSGINNTKYADIWNQDNNKEYHSKDVQNLIKDSKEKARAMVNQIKYLVSQDSSTSEIAKTVLYSKYLDADLVYYAGLYDSIGKYIKTDKDEDK
ncbi:hypothetical protein SHELI_v1c07470 [Spiroplasma helicoides]|uniref:Lipoprotein n=1 Tax=Spiroplasma helicoides TaxID=216938 RepID=A0A1B3SL87_9MOLU|nr:lipoprotein [Spiroplasma helicoides]AOG60696.1 hypothetical protein SHELI_v1c07470 [Spiroplasma helicoides]